MTRVVYRYIFEPDVPFDDVLATLRLAVLAAESIHGEEQVRLDVRFTGDPARRALVIDTSTAAGETTNRVFCGFVRREFGESSFKVDRGCEPRAEATAAH